MDEELPPRLNIFRPLHARHEGVSALGTQNSLFNVRVSTKLPEYPIGQDLSVVCIGEDNRTYYCKSDTNGRFIRATEWIATRLADHLGISVAECAILEDSGGETLFGSRCPMSLAAEFELNHFLNQTSRDETGRPNGWIGQYFARVWALDIFLDNPDRNLRNFILDRDGQIARLRAIDFASARLLQLADTNFPIATDNTTRVGKLVRNKHGAHCEAAYEMLERIGAIPPGVIEGILKEMPEDWLPNDRMGGFVEVWSNGHHKARVSRIRALIEHDWAV